MTRRTVDLVLIDASLPGMDGFDVTRIMKAQPDLADVPVLLASARVDRKIYSFGMSVGAADVIRKPVTPGFVAWRAWQLLGRHGFKPPSGVILRGGGSAPLPG
jgi:DNA-binding response OmpR family regulator